MPSVLKLGKIEKVSVRDAWPDEARNFTPWLAAEGLALLSEELGVPLQLVRCEHPVGRYSLDILATQLSEDGSPEDHLIVIENQFGSSNHDHLGKLMTYASGVGDDSQGARTVIWIAEDLREEHQRALEWLNEIAQSSVRFYGVQLELYRIGTSNPAPSLNVLVRPNEVVRARRESPSGEAGTPRNLFYVEYWTAFKAYCVDRGAIFSLQTPRPQHWIEASVGRSGYFLSFVAARRDKWMGCELHIRSANPEESICALKLHQKEIDAELLPAMPIWSVLTKSAKIQVTQPDTPLDDKAHWPSQHAWLHEQGERMYRTFAPRVRALP